MRTLLLTAALALTAFVPTFADQHATSEKLQTVLDARSDELKARDQFRHPFDTLTLFGIKPGMTVVDVLPGSWYGSILAPYLGEDGTYVGSRYGMDYYEERYDAERVEREKGWADRFPGMVAEWADKGPKTDFFRTLSAPESMTGQVDAYLFIRALHHINKVGNLDKAAAEAYRIVKPGGIVGVVQHAAREDRDDTWADGSSGYVKKSTIVAAFEAAGFTLTADSDINANARDQAVKGDRVWRLPPSGGRDEETKAIGESNRMTLVFTKAD